jgi:hypothetical protein
MVVLVARRKEAEAEVHPRRLSAVLAVLAVRLAAEVAEVAPGKTRTVATAAWAETHKS